MKTVIGKRGFSSQSVMKFCASCRTFDTKLRSTMNFARPKKLRTPFKSISVYMSSNSKSTTHYQTLNVNHDSTQAEIKSAYYELSKKFHPDVNKSEEAKMKFRDISEAYEIIGNYRSRRQYDRGMIAEGHFERPVNKNEKEPEHMAFYKSRMGAYSKPVKTADSKVYDFDEWTRAHYGETLGKTIKRKKTNAEAEIRRKNYYLLIENKLSKANSIISGFIIIIMVVVITIESIDTYDIVADKESGKGKEESREKQEN